MLTRSFRHLAPHLPLSQSPSHTRLLCHPSSLTLFIDCCAAALPQYHQRPKGRPLERRQRQQRLQRLILGYQQPFEAQRGARPPRCDELFCSVGCDGPFSRATVLVAAAVSSWQWWKPRETPQRW